jgi:hypothetical protein
VCSLLQSFFTRGGISLRIRAGSSLWSLSEQQLSEEFHAVLVTVTQTLSVKQAFQQT